VFVVDCSESAEHVSIVCATFDGQCPLADLGNHLFSRHLVHNIELQAQTVEWCCCHDDGIEVSQPVEPGCDVASKFVEYQVRSKRSELGTASN